MQEIDLVKYATAELSTTDRPQEKCIHHSKNIDLNASIFLFYLVDIIILSSITCAKITWKYNIFIK